MCTHVHTHMDLYICHTHIYHIHKVKTCIFKVIWLQAWRHILIIPALMRQKAGGLLQVQGQLGPHSKFKASEYLNNRHNEKYFYNGLIPVLFLRLLVLESRLIYNSLCNPGWPQIFSPLQASWLLDSIQAANGSLYFVCVEQPPSAVVWDSFRIVGIVLLTSSVS